ncbi:MAG: TetR/AcrR family transcriptional regulator [Clostridia bacterium]|nr:TetR/AcrR family transcriptional regulator [Clostridia bacterium]MBQ3505730.1 TetR/AcrR family transcriptional regulator [Clostridia bacterium]
MRRKNTTRLEIIQVALKMFLERGYTNTSAKAICQELGISTGNLTYYFPTKEHILAVLVELLCDFQWKMIEKETDEGYSSLLSLCLELTAMTAICEESAIGKDFYLSAYTHPITLSIIRDNDAKKAKRVFGEYCKNWKDVNYREAEMLVSGIEFATMMPTERSAPLNVRIAGALGAIMMIYNVPEDIRRKKIDKVLAMDYLAIGKKVLSEFIKYTEEATESALEAVLTK